MPRVLIADNDRAVSSLLGEMLARHGLEIAFAYDGEQALLQAREPGVAVLVCDLDMPRASGLEVLAELGGLASPPPTVVISGYFDTAIEQRLQQLPFVKAQLRKPFDLLAFADSVVRLAALRPTPAMPLLTPRLAAGGGLAGEAAAP